MSTPDNPAGYAPGYAGGYPRPMANGAGIAALVIGVISLPFSLIVVGGVFGVLAIILGFVGRARVRRGEADNPGVALAGILTGALAVVIAIALVVVLVVFATSDTGRKIRKCVHAFEGDVKAQQQCERQAGITPAGT